VRPIERGPIPTHPDTGEEIQFKTYSESRGHLKSRIGAYCSYCERKLEYGVHVEHIHPKSKREDLLLEWTNFLLSCPNCNSIKGNTEIDLDAYIWPDQDNTYHAFRYVQGFVFAAESPVKEQAEAMIQLVGLDRMTESNLYLDSEQTDERHFYRVETWGLAERQYQQLLSHDTEDKRETIAELAKATGYWSVWMTVFQEDRNMCQRFMDKYPGTQRFYFE
jgi:uncharacterized protein (TIGR02646 family)